MSEVISAAVIALSDKLRGGFDGSAKFVIPGEGAVVLDRTGVRAGDDPTEVTLTASVDTFRGILEGRVNPMQAYMAGTLQVDGSLGAAMKLGSALG